MAESSSCTIDQALAQVDILVHRPMSATEAPLLVSSNAGLEYEAWEDAALGDANVYTSGEQDITEQIVVADHLLRLAGEGLSFRNLVYATRSLSKAIPQVKSSDQANRMQLYEETTKILQPQVDRMKKFMDFSKHAVDQICAFVALVNKLFVAPKRDLQLAAPPLFAAASKLLAMLFTLNNLVNVKTAWKNDFSAYKRSCSNLRKMDPNETMENQHLYMFLANNNSILTNLRTALDKAEGAKDVLAEVVNQCVDRLENGQYITPDDKFDLFKAMTLGLALLDGSDQRDAKNDEKLSIQKVKRLHLDRALKLIKALPTIPLIADMEITLPNFLRSPVAPHIDERAMLPEPDEALEFGQRYLVVNMIGTARAQFKDYSAQLAQLSGTIARTGDCRDDVAAFVLQGLKLVSGWTAAVLEQAAWKFAHPTDKFQNRECTDDSQLYEKAVRYNYLTQDRVATVELISLIKDLQKQLLRLATDLDQFLRISIHQTVQQMAQGVIQPLVQYCNKKKRKEASKVLAAIYTLSADLDLAVDASRSLGKKERKARTFQLPEGSITLPHRFCAPTSSQLFVICAGLASLGNDDLKGSHLKSKDITPEQMPLIDAIMKLAFHFPQLLSLESTIHECGDLSGLWFKEFYLELAREIQFPIEMSLPWILTCAAMEHPHLTESILTPFELYNESANWALHSLDSECIAEEIQAEVNLCFDQLVFQLTQDVFAYAKARATALLLAQGLRSRVEQDNPGIEGRLDAPSVRWGTLLAQRSVQFFGRTININALVTQGVNALLRKTLDWALALFESLDITSVIYFEHLLENCRKTRDILAEFLAVDPFEHILAERNESMNPTSHYGRIEHKIVYEFLYDFTPNFCYSGDTQEFTRTTLPLTEPVTRETPPKMIERLMYGGKAFHAAMMSLQEGTSGVFTVQHAAAICRLVGSHKLGALINELCQNVGLQLISVVSPYVESLFKGMPKEIKQPDPFYGTTGVVGFYQGHLKPILQYPDLSNAIYQMFRTLGNVIALVSQIEMALDLVDVSDLALVRSFAFCPASVRRLRLPAQSGKLLGFHMQGGREHNKPIVITKVEPNSIASDLGVQPNDEILFCNGVDFRNPDGDGRPIDHARAIKAIQGAAGQEFIVQNTQMVPYSSSFGSAIEAVGSQFGDALFRERCGCSGPLHNGLSINGSVMRGALETLSEILTTTSLRAKWAGTKPSNGVLNMGTSEFHSLWSALQFSICMPTGSSNTFHPTFIFGEGLQWGGLMLVYLLGQGRRFQTLDYVYYILKVADGEGKAQHDDVGNLKVDEFLELARHVRNVNDRLMSLLRINFPEAEDRTTVHGVAHPPFNTTVSGHYEPCPGEHGDAGAAAAENIYEAIPAGKR